MILKRQKNGLKINGEETEVHENVQDTVIIDDFKFEGVRSFTYLGLILDKENYEVNGHRF